MTPRAKRKASWATAGFSLFGILFLFTINNVLYSLPALVLYGGLIVNTYFSIRCFSSIAPKNDTMQNIVDIGLAVLYFVLASTFNNIQNFLTIGLFLFELATIKYILLLGISGVEYHSLVRKKILLDMLGTVSCSLALALALSGYYFFAIWSLAGILTAANIYLLILKPFYKVD